MIARNFIKHPEALIAQRELELVFAIADEVTEGDLTLMKATFAAAGAWLKVYGAPMKTAAKKTPEWFAAMRRRAMQLAKAVKAAIQSLFNAAKSTGA